MLWLIRLILFALILLLIYRIITLLSNPERKLKAALEQRRFYLLDDPNNVHKNFYLAYKGVLFEGEKYSGTTADAYDVVSIFIWPHNPDSLKGFIREDFQLIEEKIRAHYPNAELDWKSPIKDFLQKSKKPPHCLE